MLRLASGAQVMFTPRAPTKTSMTNKSIIAEFHPVTRDILRLQTFADAAAR